MARRIMSFGVLAGGLRQFMAQREVGFSFKCTGLLTPQRRRSKTRQTRLALRAGPSRTICTRRPAI